MICRYAGYFTQHDNYQSMKQQQTYLQYSVLKQVDSIYNQDHNISQFQLKSILLSFSARIQQLEKQAAKVKNNNSSYQNNRDISAIQNDNVMQKVRQKLVEIEERRKAWDETMAEIFNEKKRIQASLKIKMQRIDDIQLTTTQIDNMKLMFEQKMNSFNQDKNALRIVVLDKLQKVKKQFNNDLESKYNALKHELEQQYANKLKNQLKFNITCKQLLETDVIQKMSGMNQIQSQEKKQKINDQANLISANQKLQQQPKKDEDQQRFKKGIEVIINNFNSLESFQQQIESLRPMIDRFEKKITAIGQRIQIIQNKLGDALQQGKNRKQQKQQPPRQQLSMMHSKSQKSIGLSQPMQHGQNKRFVLTSARNYKDFIIENNIITFVDRTNKNASTILLGNTSMKIKNQFEIQIVNSLNLYISIGIVDIRYEQYKDCWEKENFIILRACKGEIYCGPSHKVKETGASYRAGDRIKVQVNFIQNNINWYINGTLRAVYKSNKLHDKFITWVPLVRFFNCYDSIKWLY